MEVLAFVAKMISVGLLILFGLLQPAEKPKDPGEPPVYQEEAPVQDTDNSD